MRGSSPIVRVCLPKVIILCQQFPDTEHASAKEVSGESVTCCLTFEGCDHDDGLS